MLTITSNLKLSFDKFVIVKSNHCRIRLFNQEFALLWFMQDYDVSVTLYPASLLVDINKEEIGRVLNLNSVDHGGKIWKNMDVLIFNSWLWWNVRGARQPYGLFTNCYSICFHVFFLFTTLFA